MISPWYNLCIYILYIYIDTLSDTGWDDNMVPKNYHKDYIDFI